MHDENPNIQTTNTDKVTNLSAVRLMSPESAEFWKSIFEGFGVVLLGLTFAAGLGFWYFGRRVNDFQVERLRTFDRDLTDAKTELAKQQGRAAKAEQDVAELKKQNLITEGNLENEKLARLKIEETYAWREFSKKDQLEIVSQLNSFSPQLASLSYNITDSEANTFTLDIVATLRLAKWNVPDPQGISRLYAPTSAPPLTGVFVGSTGDKPSRDAAVALAHELSSHGFDTNIWPQNDPGSTPTVFITVEHRPKGAQGEAKVRNASKR